MKFKLGLKKKEMIYISRIPRPKARTNVYHVILRGINRQDIFLDDMDFRKCLKEIKRTKEVYKYDLYAYALMPNHIHMIIFDKENKLSQIIKSIAIKYAIYFNKKYERIGHLFQNRFKSKTVENEAYLKNLVRYIHKNPENAGLSKQYKWLSYIEYIGDKKELIDTEFVMRLFENNMESFILFHENYYKNEDIDKDFELMNKIEDDEAIRIMKEISGENNLVKIQKYDKTTKHEIINKFANIEGITKVQIARILGINKKTVYRNLK